MIRKTSSGWHVDIQPAGRGGKRYRKTFKVKADALRWEIAIKAKATDDPSFQIPRKDTRRLSELVELWYNLHGISLRAGQSTHRKLQNLASGMGNPVASAFTLSHFADYRAKRIAAGAKPATVNRERSYLRAVFGELIRLGRWRHPNPLETCRPLRAEQPELSFLSPDQIRNLLGSLKQSENSDVFLVARLALSTGARWSEAQGLRRQDVRSMPGLVSFTRTKSGKSRSVPIDDDLAKELIARLDRGSFRPSYNAFRYALRKSGITLPSGQLAHVLRHTFASHFVQNGGDLLTLQKILGHSSITVTMRYAHLAPDYLEQARRYNPLASLTLG
jgi:integrase